MKKQNNKVAVTVKLSEEFIIGKTNYEDMFLREKSMVKRGDKSIYVSAENHERLSRIAGVIGDGRIPLYAYLNNILNHHFDLFELVLIREFETKSKPLF